jgi:UDP-N-acetylmuramoyl-L-alanyl-D-glutamate--2,6-diaminopimelate ligase
MEQFAAAGRARIVVDYAHTPHSLGQVLAALREHCKGRLICVFGCGGERDRGKRAEMGGVARRIADRLIITDDNPRREDPDVIVSEILAGIHPGGEASVVRDRGEAIRQALHDADAADTVLVAGKGHEDFQLVGEEKRPFSDRDTVRTLLGLVA